MKALNAEVDGWSQTIATALHRSRILSWIISSDSKFLSPFFIFFFLFLRTSLISRATHFYVCCWWIITMILARRIWRKESAVCRAAMWGLAGGSQMGLLSGTDSLVLSSWWKPHRLGRRNAGHYQDGCNFLSQHIYLTSNEPHGHQK